MGAFIAKPLVVLLTGLLSLAAYAPSTPSIADFKANILIVDSKAEIEKWVLASPETKAASGRKRSVEVGERVYLPAVVTDFKPEHEDVDLSGDFQLIAPNGNVVMEKKQAFGAQHFDLRSPSVIVLNPVLDAVFDASDTPGRYTVRIVITDRQKGTVATAEERFSLVLSN